MPIPPFVVALREKIGHARLPMSGVCAVVVQEGVGGPEVLLVQRADCGLWTPVTGILEPGEDPDLAAVREVWEEAGIEVRVDRLVSVESTGFVTHANGDQAVYLDLVFACRWVSGEPHPNDDEAQDVRWWPVDEDLPVLNPRFRRAIADCVAPPAPVRFGAAGRMYRACAAAR